MKSLKKIIGLVFIAGPLLANAHPISKEEGIKLLAPLQAKIEKIDSEQGSQSLMIGSYSKKVKTDSGKEVICEYIMGMRSTKLESFNGKMKRLQEHYEFPKDRFEKACSNNSQQSIQRVIYIEKGEKMFFPADINDKTTFDLSELNGKEILTMKNDKSIATINLSDLEIKTLEQLPYTSEYVSVSHRIYNKVSFKNVDVSKIDVTDVIVETDPGL